MTFSRATASAICRSSSRFALTAIVFSLRLGVRGSRPWSHKLIGLFFVFRFVLVRGLCLRQLVGEQCIAESGERNLDVLFFAIGNLVTLKRETIRIRLENLSTEAFAIADHDRR